VDVKTLAWWMEKWSDGAAMPSLLTGLPMSEAGRMFCEWVAAHVAPDAEWWFKGTSFDPGILGSFLEDGCGQVPWKFWQVCDMRTVCSWEGEIRTKGAAHNALEDARDQAKMLVAMARRKAWILQEAAAIASKELEMECMWKGGKA
jgi:hypothetical protein